MVLGPAFVSMVLGPAFVSMVVESALFQVVLVRTNDMNLKSLLLPKKTI